MANDDLRALAELVATLAEDVAELQRQVRVMPEPKEAWLIHPDPDRPAEVSGLPIKAWQYESETDQWLPLLAGGHGLARNDSLARSGVVHHGPLTQEVWASASETLALDYFERAVAEGARCVDGWGRPVKAEEWLTGDGVWECSWWRVRDRRRARHYIEVAESMRAATTVTAPSPRHSG